MTPENDDHPIVIEPAAMRVRVFAMGRQVADTVRALALQEPGHPSALYLPREDVDMTLLKRGAHTTVCPDKGIASYYAIEVGGDCFADAGWSYEDPKPMAEKIRGFISFHPNLVFVDQPAKPAR